MQISYKEAENNLLNLIEKAFEGEEIIIQKDDKTEVQLVPRWKSFPFGIMPNLKMKDNFDDPLPPDIAGPFGMIDQEESKDKN